MPEPMEHHLKPKPSGLFVGLTTLDVIHHTPRHPLPNEKVTADRQTVSAGGPAASAAVVFAALGGRARLLTAVGDGAVAGLILADLEQQGVEVIDLATSRTEPAVSSVVVTDNGERSVISRDATAQRVGKIENLSTILKHTDVVLADGHHPQLALEAAKAANDSAVPLVIDAGRWKPIMADLLPLSQNVICSSDFRTPGSGSSTVTAQSIRDYGVPNVAVTHGAKPIQWWTPSGSGEVAVPAVTAVDTLGAGDAFHGSFAWYLTQPQTTFANQLEASGRIASLRCANLGPRKWLSLI